MSLDTIEVRAGDRIVARYKRANRPATKVDLLVDACAVYPSTRGPVAMIVGTNCDIESASAGLRMALRVAALDPRGLGHQVQAEEIKDFDASAIYVTPPNDAFAFIEEVDMEDRPWAEMLGGKPLDTMLVDSVKVAVVTAQ